MTLGSLFDGSGGFPLAGLAHGITPVWASEIEPFPIRVTTKRIPSMKHYGDVSKMHGNEIEPVDIITFGSPCQDMSLAGRRAGLDGSRSNLFYEAVRIIKEMRKATNGKYPRYTVWENVPGAFSSNKGEDFRCVLEAVIGIAEPNAQVPLPEKARWPYADLYMGDGWSVAYRTLDAQYWGVPQRRRRIYLVADFAGRGAGKILFEPEGLSGYSAQGFRTREETAGASAESAGETGCSGVDGYRESEGMYMLNATEQYGVAYGISREAFSQGQNAKFWFATEEEVEPSMAAKGPGAVAAPTYSASKSSSFANGAEEMANTLVASDYKDPPLIYNKPYGSYSRMEPESMAVTDEKPATLMNGTNPGYQNGVAEPDYIVRRLTPTECARLQGFPDNWCADLGTENPTAAELSFWRDVFDAWTGLAGQKQKTDKQIIKWLKSPHSDSAEYKMWGNGVALPCVEFVLGGIARELKGETIK